ncbi:XrtA/PEP-CTERM system histidine kinase PrsK [Herbaspirillum robiniae]|uniref:XrtA/PEP-CTERM system histidine kinase PrsK n=1 Tax=Herbaspirillum robiniae TaxID=2014887 RepID=UPI003D76E94F
MLGMLKEVALASYLAAASTFLLFGLFLFARNGGQLRRLALGVACCVNAGWAILLVVQLFLPSRWPVLVAVFESLRNASWDVFLLLLIGVFGKDRRTTIFNANRWVLAVAVFYAVMLACTLSVSWQNGYPALAGDFIAVTVLRTGAAILGLFLVEQLYRNTLEVQRWGIKFACIGMGVMFAYDFYMYSDALLFRHFNPDAWVARGFINALAVPLIAISTLRNPRWSLGITVSRHVLFHSAALFGAAGYLLAMALAGYYLRIFGGTWGSVIQLAFLCGAVALLLGILFSGVFRSRLRVFISKHFYSYNYDYREVWLSFTRSLSSKGPDLETRVVEALAKLVESPGGAVFMVRDDGSFDTAARWNCAAGAQADPANAGLIRFLEEKQWVIDLTQHKINPGHYGHVAIPAWLSDYPRAWLVVPMEVHGRLLGIVMLAQPRSPVKLNWEVTDLLKLAGRQAGSYLAQQQFATELMVARQFESFNRMSTFVVHDLKNLVSQLSLLMANAERHKDNPEFQRDMIDTVDFSVQKMRLLLHKLSRKDSAETSQPIDLDALLERAIRGKSAAEPKPVLTIEASGMQVQADWERLERVLGHIVQNAIEAVSPKNGRVEVRLARDGAEALVEIGDNGHGMSEEFIRRRLFKPFETTKSAGMGIGVFESREYVQALGGTLHVESVEAVGTRFFIRLPLLAPVKAATTQLQEETSESK